MPPPGGSTVAARGPAPPRCRFGSKVTPRHSLDDWATTLVDTTYRLPADYAPRDLVPVAQAGVGGWGSVRQFVIGDLRSLGHAARDAGLPFDVLSAHRGYDRQGVVFAGWVASHGEAAALRSSARAGHSEHQLGTAIDVRAKGGPEPWSVDFGASRTGIWLAANAWRFGFVVSYPAGAEDVTCYEAEPWHLRYVGRAEARAVHDAGVTLREWLWAHARGATATSTH